MGDPDVQGRDDDIQGLEAALRAGVRLIAVTGPEGVGKSTLARSFVALTDTFWQVPPVWCHADEAHGERALCRAVGGELGITLQPSATLQHRETAVRRALQSRGRTLLVLDDLPTFASVGQLVTRWLADTSVVVLLTTRHEVNDPAVFERKLSGMQDAAALFHRRCRQAQASYPSTGERVDRAGDLVARFHANPRALELAAAPWVDGAGRPAGPAPSPHQAASSALDWSWMRASGEERRTAVALAPWRGTVGADTARRLSNTSAALPALARRAWLDVVSDDEGNDLAYTVRSDVRKLVRERQNEAYFEALLRCADTCLGPLEAQLKDAFDGGVDAALDSVRSSRDLLVAQLGDLASIPEPDGPQRDVIFRIAHVLGVATDAGLSPTQADVVTRALASSGEPSEAEARACIAVSRSLMLESELDRALAMCRTAEQVGHAVNSPLTVAQALLSSCLVLAHMGKPLEAVDTATRALDSFRSLRHKWGEALALLERGSWLASVNRRVEAMDAQERAVVLLRRVSHSHGLARALAGSAVILMEDGDLAQARDRLEDAVDLAQRSGASRMASVARGYLALLHLSADRPDEAVEHLDIVVQGAAEIGDYLTEGYFCAIECAARARLDDVTGARACWERALARLDPDSTFMTVARVHHAHLDLALARGAQTQGERDAARLRAAEARSIVTPELLQESDDARIALGLLERAVGAAEQGTVAPTPTTGPRLVVAHDGTWFDGGDGRVELANRPLLCSLLTVLVAAAPERRALSSQELIETLWQGERLLPSVGLNRLNVALSTLRKLGLRRFLVRDPGGYRLEARVLVR